MKSGLTRFASCRLDVLQQKLMPFAKLRSRIGVPQTVALLLLLVFVAQCLWFMARVPLSATEGSYIETGLLHLERFASASSPERSPLGPAACWTGRAAERRGKPDPVSQRLSPGHPLALPAGWSFAGCVAVVCGAPALRQHRRLHRARTLRVLAGDGGLVQPGRTGNRRRVGRLWSHLHCHRGRAHAIRSTRSGAVELAPHSADGPFHRHLCWSSILALDTTCPRTRIHALGWARASGRGPGHLRCGLRVWTTAALGDLQLSSCRLCGRAAQRNLAEDSCRRSILAHSLLSVRNLLPAKRTWSGAAADGLRGYVCGVEARAVLRDSSTAHHRRDCW